MTKPEPEASALTAAAPAAPEAAPVPSTKKKSEMLTLEEPIVRGDQIISEVELRRPTNGQMRGLNLQDIQRADINTMIALIPKITVPPLIAHEVEESLCLADTLAIAGAISGFLMTAADKAALAKVMGFAEQEKSTE